MDSPRWIGDHWTYLEIYFNCSFGSELFSFILLFMYHLRHFYSFILNKLSKFLTKCIKLALLVHVKHVRVTSVHLFFNLLQVAAYCLSELLHLFQFTTYLLLELLHLYSLSLLFGISRHHLLLNVWQLLGDGLKLRIVHWMWNTHGLFKLWLVVDSAQRFLRSDR